MCLAAAAAERPALVEHLGALAAIEVLELGFVGASLSGSAIAAGAGWRFAHAVAAAGPTLEWPRGLPVVTAVPALYEGRGIRTISLS